MNTFGLGEKGYCYSLFNEEIRKIPVLIKHCT